jgi:hypothetical protein
MNLELQIPEEIALLLTNEYADLSRAAIEALALEGYRSRRFSERKRQPGRVESSATTPISRRDYVISDEQNPLREATESVRQPHRSSSVAIRKCLWQSQQIRAGSVPQDSKGSDHSNITFG